MFKSDNAQNSSRNNVNCELKRILKKWFGIEDTSTYSLRHNFGTRYIESGVAPVEVQKIIGYTYVFITLNIYTSAFDKYKVKVIDKVN